MFFTKDNITLCIAILGAVLSVGNVVYNAVIKRTKLSFSSTFYSVTTPPGTMQLYLHIANESVLPVSITRIQLKVDNELFDCDQFPKRVINTSVQKGGETSSERNYYTQEMPISLASLGATCGFIQFRRSPGVFPLAPENITLLISTNRRKKLEYVISVPFEKTIADLM